MIHFLDALWLWRNMQHPKYGRLFWLSLNGEYVGAALIEILYGEEFDV
jgi:hypothetical protein